MLALVVLVSAGCAAGNPAETVTEPPSSVTPLDPTTVPFSSLGSGIVSFNRREGNQLTRYVVDVSGRTVSSASLGADEETRISPDGRRFVSLKKGTKPAPDWDVYVTEAGGQAVRLTFDGGAKNTPNWSYDGKRIFYISTVASEDVAMQLTLATGAVGRFAGVLNGLVLQTRTFLESVDGVFLFAIADQATIPSAGDPSYAPPNVIYSIRGDAQQRRQLTPPSKGFVRTPVWSPDGKRFAFTTLYTNWTISVANADGTNLTTIASMPSAEQTDNGASLCWSGDGTRILFNKYEVSSAHIYSMRPDGTDLTQVTFGAGRDVNVSCSH